MKSRILLLGIALSGLLFPSCSEDFQVTAPYKEVTVVYGLLNPLDTAHYIRIQKAFLDENKSAIRMATNPDSSHFSQLNVTLTAFSDPEGNQPVQTHTLDKVNLNQEGFTKEDGAFFTDPSYAYKFKASLNPYQYYRLRITHPETGRQDSSDLFGIVNAETDRNPSNFYVRDFVAEGLTIDFSRTGGNFRYVLEGYFPRNGKVVEGKIRFHYVDRHVLSGTETRRYVDVSLGRDVDYGADRSFRFEVPNAQFYSSLSELMGPAPANTERYLDSMDYYLYAGSPELFTYEQINLGQTGLTSDQIRPYYTNLRGENILGLLASRTLRFYSGAVISPQTLEALKTHPETASLNIRGFYDK